MRVGWIIVAALVILAVVGSFAYSAMYGGTPVQTHVARLGPIEEFIEERGQTRLPKTHFITMPYEGRIDEITLAEGTPVKAGEVVAKIVPSDLDNKLKQAQAAVDRLAASLAENNDERIERSSLEQALKFVESMERTVEAAKAQVQAGEAKRDFAKDNFDRLSNLFERKAAAEEEFRRARLDMVEALVEYRQNILLESAMQAMQAATNLMPVIVRQYIERKDLSGAVLERERAEAAARLDQVKLDIERSQMKSPIDGVILRRHETNERLLAAGTVLLEIGRLEELEVEADVLSQDVVRVQKGDRTLLFGPAIGPEPALAAVDRIYPAGFTKVSSLGVEEQRVKVIVRLSPPVLDRLLRERGLGVDYRVQVRIYTAEKPSTLILPRAALFRGPQGDWQTYRVDNNRAILQTVEVGLMNDEHVEITRGLTAGQSVILSPEMTLEPGERVREVRAEVDSTSEAQ